MIPFLDLPASLLVVTSLGSIFSLKGFLSHPCPEGYSPDLPFLSNYVQYKRVPSEGLLSGSL